MVMVSLVFVLQIFWKNRGYVMRNNLIPDIRKNSKRIIAARIILLILIISNLSFIWINSSKVSSESDKTSKSIARTVAKKVVKDFEVMPKPQQQKHISKFNNKIRSLAHFIQFVPLGVLLWLICLTVFLPKDKWYIVPILCLAISVFISFGVALSDEIHQIFVKGRSFEFKDIMTDTLGSLSGSFICVIIYIVKYCLMDKTNCQ